MDYIFLIIWLFSISFCTWAAKKIGKSTFLGFGFGMIAPVASCIAYAVLLWEFKKTGKAEFRIW